MGQLDLWKYVLQRKIKYLDRLTVVVGGVKERRGSVVEQMQEMEYAGTSGKGLPSNGNKKRDSGSFFSTAMNLAWHNNGRDKRKDDRTNKNDEDCDADDEVD